MSIDAQTFVELLRAREAFAARDVPLTAVILGDCAFATEWATGDNRRDLAEFASRMNLSRVETLDVAGNPTVRTDITAPLPPALEGAFDLVLDIGTLYWCFDVAAGWRNCFALLKPRGLIVHHSAMTGYFGRGYYTFQPRLFRDLYRSSGFREITIKTRARKFFEGSSLLRRVLLRLSPPSLAFREVGADAIFVNAADWRGFRFGPTVGPEAPMLPNDAEILCIARRDTTNAFTPP
ncbi:MAG TPA: hypothetical protein VK515_04385, partial [Rhizomicrobium sp.]|nr:hypothetical protein [Rhizomicrobium sp.]